MKYRVKQWISLFMIGILVFSGMSSDIYAATQNNGEVLEYLTEDSGITVLPNGRIEELEGTESVYFGTMTADLSEEDGYYSFPIYREGNLETPAEVTLITMDVSALYGSDYEICDDAVVSRGKTQTLMQQNYASSVLMSEEEVEAQAQLVESIYEHSMNEETEGEQEEDESSVSLYGEELEGAGELTKGILGSLSITDSEGLSDEELSEALDSGAFDCSAGVLIDFAPGEDRKDIVFHVMDDDIEEGQEMFQFVLVDANNTVIRKQYTFTAVINDDEEEHDALISFSKPSYSSVAGQVTVTVNRTGSLYSIIEFNLSSAQDTAVAGENYEEFDETLLMQPYQTSADYTFEVRGQGRMEVLLTAETSCQVGGTESAEVLIDVTETEEEIEELRKKQKKVETLATAGGVSLANVGWQDVALQEDGTLLDGDVHDRAFDIEVRGKTYKVQPVKEQDGSIYRGKIIDQNAGNAKVGDYYYITQDRYTYGLYYGNERARRTSRYNTGEGWAYLEWYHSFWTRTGGSGLRAKYDIPASYYRFVVPDWEGLSSRFGNQAYDFNVITGKERIDRRLEFGMSGGAFSRRVDDRVLVELPNRLYNTRLWYECYVSDTGRTTPNNEMNVYGFVCMSKAYAIDTSSPVALQYLSNGSGSSKTSTIPLTATVLSGVSDGGSAHVSFADVYNQQAFLVFSANSVNILEHAGMFGVITGWRIQYKEKEEYLIYPKCMEEFFDKRIKEGKAEHSDLEYTEKTKQEWFEKASDMMRIPFDGYFIDMLQDAAIRFDGANAVFGNAAAELRFTPICDYKNVEIVVQSPLKGSGHFTDQGLEVTAAGTSAHQFHAGDTLDLRAVSTDKKYTVGGYQYRLDSKSNWTTVEGEYQLFIPSTATKAYVRPYLKEDVNRIEIRYYGDAKKHVTVDGLVSQEDLNGTAFAGENLLDIHPDQRGEDKINKRVSPQIGNGYEISILVKDKPARKGYVYRPYILENAHRTADKSKCTKIYGQKYPVIAAPYAEDNVITIGVEEVPESSLSAYTVSGMVRLKQLETMYETATAKQRVPVSGFLVSAAGAQDKISYTEGGKTVEKDVVLSVSSTSDKGGIYTLGGVVGRAGELVPVMIRKGQSDAEVIYVTLPSSGTVCSAKVTDLTYPASAPQPISIMYRYLNDEHNKQDLKNNTVRIYDDSLTVTLKVDEKEREAKEVVLRVSSPGGTSKEYKAERKKDGQKKSDLWVYTFNSMRTAFKNGDQMEVYVVDSESLVISDGRTTSSAALIYPVMDTGLRFAEEFIQKNPIWYAMDLEPGTKPDIPILGMGGDNPGATSGAISWDIVLSPDLQSKNVVLNLGFGLGTLDGELQLAMVNNFKNTLRENKIKVAEAEKAGLQQRAEDLKKKAPEIGMYQYADILKGDIDEISEKIQNWQDQIKANNNSSAKLLEELSDPEMSNPFVYARADITTSIALTYTFINGKFLYTYGSVVFGFSVMMDVTFSKTIVVVPAYINVGGAYQLSYAGTFISKNASKAIEEGKLTAAKGNISNLVNPSPGLTSGLLNSNFSVYGKPGIGVCGIIGGGGAVDLDVTLAIVSPELSYPENPTPEDIKAIDKHNEEGYVVSISGGIYLNLLITKIEVTVVKKTWGGGRYKDRTSVSFFGNPKARNSSDNGEGELFADSSAEELFKDNNEITTISALKNGSTEMEGFGVMEMGEAEELTASDPYADPLILMADAAEDPDTQIIRTAETGDGAALFMVFLGNRGNATETEADENRQAVYYSTYLPAGDGAWTAPQLLDDDANCDASLNVTQDGDRVIVTWSSAVEELKKTDSWKEKYSKLRLKAAALQIDAAGQATVTMEPVFLSKETAPLQNAALQSASRDPEEADEGLEKSAETATPSGAVKAAETEEETGEVRLSAAGSQSLFFDCQGSGWMYDGKLYSVFMRYSLDDVEDPQDLYDFTVTDPTVYVVEYDPVNKTRKLEAITLMEGNALLQDAGTQFVEIEGTENTDENKNFLVLTYIQNTDGDPETDEDNDLMMCLVELREGEEPFCYPALPVSDTCGTSEYSRLVRTDYGDDGTITREDISKDPDQDGIIGLGMSAPVITELKDSYYLTYLKNGYLFETIDIGQYLSAMFGEDYIAQMYRDRVMHPVNGEAWYDIDAEDLNEAWQVKNSTDADRWITEEEYTANRTEHDAGTDPDSVESGELLLFETSGLNVQATGTYFAEETSLSGDTEKQLSVTEYTLVSDGEDIFIIYSSGISENVGMEKELYITKLNYASDLSCGGTDAEPAEDPDDDIYYSKPVRLTDTGKVFSKTKAVMDGNTITVVSAMHDETIPENGGLNASDYKLAVVRYKPAALGMIDEEAVLYRFSYSPEADGTDYINLSYDVTNTGAEPLMGYQTWVERNGERLFFADFSKKVKLATESDAVRDTYTEEGEEPRLLMTGAVDSFTAALPVTEEAQLTYRIVLANADGSVELDSADVPVRLEAETELTDVKVTYSLEEGYQAVVTAENRGALRSEKMNFLLKVADEYDESCSEKTKDGRNLQTAAVDGLEPGAKTEITVPFTVTPEDLDALGVLYIEAVPEGKESGPTGQYSPGYPMMVWMEGGKESISLSRGVSRKLEAEAMPYPELSGSISYYSTDPSVVSVAEDGTMTAKSNGTTTVGAYLPAWGLANEITVTVQKNGNDDDGSESQYSADYLPGYVDKEGTWEQDADGNWTYTLKNGGKVRNRWLAIANSTFGKGYGFEWYFFDKDGKMLTGWFRDSDDRMYYLQVIADGFRGRMLTGWQKIDGKWYYFEPQSTGYKGSMYRGTTTRDGYTVGADGVWTGN